MLSDALIRAAQITAPHGVWNVVYNRVHHGEASPSIGRIIFEACGAELRSLNHHCWRILFSLEGLKVRPCVLSQVLLVFLCEN